MSLLIISDERFDEHAPPSAHPERPERLLAIREALAGRDMRGAREADREELERVHSGAYLRELESVLSGSRGWIDADTYFTPASWEAALCATGAVVDATRAVLAGQVRAGMALVRPPGHHAEADRAMGFCLLNNVAVAAAAARAAGAERVAILDWDVHHGNGTQHIFEHDPAVLFASVHQFPFYPGTGAPTEVGRGAGVGATVNVGLPAGCGDTDYAHVMEAVVVPTLRAYRPDLILVSAGFDAGASDPLAGMRVSTDGFGVLAARIRQVADEVCGGRLVLALEGGYDLSGLSAAVSRVVAVLEAETAPVAEMPGQASELARDAVSATLRAHAGGPSRWVPRDGSPVSTPDPLR